MDAWIIIFIVLFVIGFFGAIAYKFSKHAVGAIDKPGTVHHITVASPQQNSTNPIGNVQQSLPYPPQNSLMPVYSNQQGNLSNNQNTISLPTAPPPYNSVALK